VGEKTPRVTIVGLNYSPEPTGIAPYTSGLAAGLVGDGWNVQVVTGYPHYPEWRVADGYVGRRMYEIIEGVSVTRVRSYLPNNPAGVKRLLLEISFGFASIFTKWRQPDVVVLVTPALFSIAIAQLRARLSRKRPKVIVWVQDIYSLGVTETGAMGDKGAGLMTKVESYVLRKADAVVAIHDRFKRYLVSGLRVHADRVHVVRNWTHIKPLVVDRQEFRQKFGWGDEVVVLHAGNMGAKQALENVVEAARLADASSARIRFVLVGNGNQRDLLKELGTGIVRLDFMESLNATDFQGAMAAADILLVNEKPGVAEMAVPSKLTSYFSAARPVLAATDAGSITGEEIESAGAGVRVDAGNPAALLEASLKLGNDAEAKNEFGRNGAEFQARVLSARAAIAQYAELINSLAGVDGRPTGSLLPDSRGVS
jgi:glycosyltransferase involved in cell wall biosynthesis